MIREANRALESNFEQLVTLSCNKVQNRLQDELVKLEARVRELQKDLQ